MNDYNPLTNVRGQLCYEDGFSMALLIPGWAACC